MTVSSDFEDRCLAAFLGLALGDAYGRTLEFVTDDRVRTLPILIEEGHFRWTDDSHMSLYLAEAILRSRPYTEESFGKNVAEQFFAWSNDPLTPSTAPGRTCLDAMENYRVTRDWKTCGSTWSDGCGAVMRICPLALAFQGQRLNEAARVSTIVTHNTPEAVYSSIAASQMLRKTLELARFDESIIHYGIKAVSEMRGEGSICLEALAAALDLPLIDSRWINEDAMPPGDGGWRSQSAVGLAAAAALRFQNDFEKAVDTAARIYGDSDSVACLTGMFIGAAQGTACLPENWLRFLPGRDSIEDLVTQLLAYR